MSPPSTMCSCASTIVTPMPASTPCTTAGEMASAPLATLLIPSSTWIAPASTVMAQVVGQPNRVTASAMITA